MKRILILLLLFSITTTVHAEELKKILEDEESLSGTGRSAFVTVEISDGDTVQAIIDTIAPSGKFNIVGDVISLVTQEDEHNYADMTPYNIWLTSPFTWLMPGQFKISKSYIPFTTPQRGSAHYGAVLKISGRDIYTIVSDCFLTNGNPPELSQGLPDRPPFYEKAQSFGAIWSGAKLVTKDGRVVFDWPSFPVKRIKPEDCGRTDPEVDRTPKLNNMTNRAIFSQGEAESNVIQTIGETITDAAGKVIDFIADILNVHLTAVVTQKLKTDGNAIFALFDYWSNGRETAEVISNQTRTKNDGMVSTFVPYKLRKNPVGFAGTDNVIKLSGNYADEGKPYVSREVGANRAYQNGRQAACPVYSYQILKGKGPVKEAFKIGGQVPTDCTPPPSPTPTPPGGWNCRTNLPELASEQTNTQGKQWADNLFDPPCDATNNAWEMCHNDVIDRASKPNSCYDPIFALTIWLHETGASNYQCTVQVHPGILETDVEDFGQHTGGVPKHDFSAQLDSFLSLSYADKTCPHTLNDWWSIFWFGACYSTMSDVRPSPNEPSQKEQIGAVVAYTQYVYGILGGGTIDWPVKCN